MILVQGLQIEVVYLWQVDIIVMVFEKVVPFLEGNVFDGCA